MKKSGLKYSICLLAFPSLILTGLSAVSFFCAQSFGFALFFFTVLLLSLVLWMWGMRLLIISLLVPLQNVYRLCASESFPSWSSSLSLFNFLQCKGLSHISFFYEKLDHVVREYQKGIETEVQAEKEKLLRAKDAAEKACRDKGDFLAVMSHEIRTPMNGVMGLTTLLEDTDLDEQQHYYLSTLRASSESLLRIIDDILDFSKLEKGKLKLEHIPFDLREVLDDMLNMTVLRAEKKGLDYQLFVDPHVPSILIGDSGRLQQILINLIGNAFKFTEKGSISVSVTLHEQCDDVSVLCFRVTDTGIGIPKEKQRLLFRSFSQADGSICRRYGGSGLGLAISKELCSLMGGSIGLVSAKDSGAEFYFTASFAIQRPQEKKDAWVALTERDRILVVDGSIGSRNVLREQFCHWGATVVEADSADAAMAILQGDCCGFRWAFLAFDLPDLTGLQLGEWITDHCRQTPPLLILMHQSLQHDPLGSLLNLRFADFLAKPLRYGELLRCLATLCHHELPEKQQKRGLRLEAGRLKKERILLAEDDYINQQVICGFLKKLGYSHVDVVTGGREAVAAVAAKRYHLVLMDVEMADMDGLEATRIIRMRQGYAQNMPIIALTAHAVTGFRQKCLDAGMTDYLTKPLVPEMLRALLDQYPGNNSQNASVSLLSARKADNYVTADRQIFDWQELEERLLEDKEIAQNVVREFLREMPDRFTELFASLQQGEQAKAEGQIHRIKGSVSSLAVRSLHSLVCEVEEVIRSGGYDQVYSYYAAKLLAALHRAEEVMLVYLESDHSRSIVRELR